MLDESQALSFQPRRGCWEQMSNNPKFRNDSKAVDLEYPDPYSGGEFCHPLPPSARSSHWLPAKPFVKPTLTLSLLVSKSLQKPCTPGEVSGMPLGDFVLEGSGEGGWASHSVGIALHNSRSELSSNFQAGLHTSRASLYAFGAGVRTFGTGLARTC